MEYKIAVGSSDGFNIDLKFGEADRFLIYRVDENNCEFLETRAVSHIADEKAEDNNCDEKTYGREGCAGNGQGCKGAADVIDKVGMIADCRCVVCAKIGFQAQKQFERKAISVFDVECKIDDALKKIRYYYDKVDHHQSFRKQE